MKLANICISHKETPILKNSEFYHIQVGSELSSAVLGIHADNLGDNISKKNPMYCELTGLYWFWKNDFKNYDVVVVNHYRRLFLEEDKQVLTQSKILEILREYEAFVPYPKHYPVSISQQYEIMHYEKDWKILKQVLDEKYPQYDYKKYWDKSNKGFLYNMFGLKNEDFDHLMFFLFDVLFEVEQRINISGYSIQQKRVFGFMAERLTSLFIQSNFSKVRYLSIEFENGDKEKVILKRESKTMDFIYQLQKPFSSVTSKVLRSILSSKSK